MARVSEGTTSNVFVFGCFVDNVGGDDDNDGVCPSEEDGPNAVRVDLSRFSPLMRSSENSARAFVARAFSGIVDGGADHPPASAGASRPVVPWHNFPWKVVDSIAESTAHVLVRGDAFMLTLEGTQYGQHVAHLFNELEFATTVLAAVVQTQLRKACRSKLVVAYNRGPPCPPTDGIKMGFLQFDRDVLHNLYLEATDFEGVPPRPEPVTREVSAWVQRGGGSLAPLQAMEDILVLICRGMYHINAADVTTAVLTVSDEGDLAAISDKAAAGILPTAPDFWSNFQATVQMSDNDNALAVWTANHHSLVHATLGHVVAGMCGRAALKAYYQVLCPLPQPSLLNRFVTRPIASLLYALVLRPLAFVVGLFADKPHEGAADRSEFLGMTAREIAVAYSADPEQFFQRFGAESAEMAAVFSHSRDELLALS